jgi:hypothetical protein
MDTPLTTSSAVNYNRLLDATAGGAGPTWHAKLGLDSGATMAARIGANGSWQLPAGLHFNAPTLLDDPDSRSVFFSRGQSYGTVTSPLASASFTADMALQLTGVAAKHVLLTRDENVREAGRFSVEIVADGAGGMRPRVFSRDGGGSPVVLIGTNPATVPLGVPCKFTYVRDSANGSQKIYVNGQEIALTLASGSMPTSWAAVPGGTWAIGMWPIGHEAGFEGLIAEVALWSSALALPDIQSLVVPAGLPAIHLSDVTAGDVVANQLKQISLARATAPAGLSPTIIAQGARGVASTSGTDVSYQAGATTGSDSFEIQGSKDGRQSRVALFNINVLATEGGAAPDDRDAHWQKQGYDLAWSHTPEQSDVGVAATTYFTSRWNNGHPLAQGMNLDSSQGDCHVVNHPVDGLPCVRGRIFPGGNRVMGPRGQQLGPTGGGKTTVVFSQMIYSPSPGGWVNNNQSGTYIGLGVNWGSTDGQTSAGGGSSNSPLAWVLRLPLNHQTNPVRFFLYYYPPRPSSSSKSGQVNSKLDASGRNPVSNVWQSIEMEVIPNTVGQSNGIINLFIDGKQVLNWTGRVMRTAEHPGIKPKGMGVNLKHNSTNQSGGNETVYWKNWRIYTK